MSRQRHATVTRRRLVATTTTLGRRRRGGRRLDRDVVVVARNVTAAAPTASHVVVVTGDGALRLLHGILILDLSLPQTTQPRHLSATTTTTFNADICTQHTTPLTYLDFVPLVQLGTFGSSELSPARPVGIDSSTFITCDIYMS